MSSLARAWLVPAAPVGHAAVVRLLPELLESHLTVEPLAVGLEGHVGDEVPRVGQVQLLHVEAHIRPGPEGQFTEQLGDLTEKKESDLCTIPRDTNNSEDVVPLAVKECRLADTSLLAAGPLVEQARGQGGPLGGQQHVVYCYLLQQQIPFKH